MGVYRFKIWGKEVAVDVGSGNFFELDKVASEAITFLDGHTDMEAKRKLSKKYGEKIVTRTINNLNRLKKNKMLFSAKRTNDNEIKRKISDLTLNIVNSCNLRCRYCWNKAGAYTGSLDKKQLMGKRVAFKAVDLLIKESRGSEDLVVDFYGGEPLINFSLIKEVINYCKNIQKRNKINFRFLLATNGTLLNKDKGRFLIDNNVDIAVSLDGNKVIQDKQRPFYNGRGSFDEIIGNINSLGKQYIKRMVGRATFTPFSKQIITTFKFLQKVGFERIEVCESEKAGYGLEVKNKFFFSGDKGLKTLKSLYYDLAKFYTQEIIKGNLTYENTYFNRFFKQLSRLYHIQSIVGTCSAGFSLIAVDIDGAIYPCTAFVGISDFRIGNVNLGINEDKVKGFLNTKISSSDECDKCWATRICLGCGSCYNLNYFTNKSPGRPDNYYCELFRYKTKLMMAMIAEISQKNPSLLDMVLIPEYYAARGRKKK